MSFINTTGWNDFLMSGLQFPTAHATAPTIKTFQGNIQALAFIGTGGNLKETWGTIHILHDYIDATVLFPHIHWSHIIVSPTGNVFWQIEFSVAKTGAGIFPAATTVTLTDTPATQFEHRLIETSTGNAIPITNVEPDTVIMFRVFRDPANENDTFENDAFLLYLDLHFQSDNTLSNEKVTPFTKRNQFGTIAV